jgi:sec-independent protein translocase protein TatC
MARIAPVGHEEQLTLVDHLDELRTRLIISIAAIAVAFAFTFWQSEWVLGVITAPVDSALSTDSASEEEKDRDSDEVQYAHQQQVSEALGLLSDDAAATRKAVDALRASETVEGDRTLAAQLASLSAAMAKRGDQLAKLDLTPPEIDRRPITLGVTEPFLVTISSSFYAAILLVLPFLLFQLYAFVVPAFTPRERQAAVPLMFMVPVLFMMGVVFAYYLVVPQAANFLLNFNDNEFDIQVGGRDAVKFITSFLIAIGLMFQLPVGILALTRSGIVTVTQLRQSRRYAIIGFAVLAAFLTPTPDPGTMLLALAPLVVLYELSILLASWLERRRPLEPLGEEPDLDRLADEYAPLPVDDDQPVT